MQVRNKPKRVALNLVHLVVIAFMRNKHNLIVLQNRACGVANLFWPFPLFIIVIVIVVVVVFDP